MLRKAQFMKAYKMPISAYNELTDREIDTLLIIDRETKIYQQEKGEAQRRTR